ncbi:hypothetical protein N8940_00405 [Sphingomonadaceae bacterium]|nr:hypothetical protein [Sphingomonadaceae bacterium]
MNKHASKIFAASIAAAALAASPPIFAQGQNNGNGNGKAGQAKKGNGSSDRGNADRGNSNRSSADRGNSNRGNANQGNANRGNAGNRSAERQAAQQTRGNGNGNGNRNASNNRSSETRAANGNGNNGNANRGQRGQANNGNRGNGNNGNAANFRTNGNRGNGNQAVRVRSRDGNDVATGFALPQLRQAFARDTRVINGCPPGLAKKRNGCLPPGQARTSYRSYNPGFFGLNGIGNGSYFYDDGYLLSYRGDSLAGYLPLLGGALGIGNVWPSSYAAASLPAYYNSYYGLDDPRGYRFADNVIYRVDPETAAIASVAALLTGDDITIGQPLPVGYDVYNVPYNYRTQYADGPRANYRYVDGYIYEVDPETALVVSAIDLVI